MARADYGVVLFHSTQGAMKADSVLVRAGFSVKLIPTPREFSSDCGTALRFLWRDLGPVQTAMASGKVSYQGIHRMAVQKKAHGGR